MDSHTRDLLMALRGLVVYALPVVRQPCVPQGVGRATIHLLDAIEDALGMERTVASRRERREAAGGGF